MPNLWPESFQANDLPDAKSILEEQAKYLPKLTGELVYAEVSELSSYDRIGAGFSGEFMYRFDLKGKFLEGYRFNVLMFGHDITLYPVEFRLDEQIAGELGVERHFMKGHSVSISTPDALVDHVSQILRTERLGKVVGSIMRLSK